MILHVTNGPYEKVQKPLNPWQIVSYCLMTCDTFNEPNLLWFFFHSWLSFWKTGFKCTHAVKLLKIAQMDLLVQMYSSTCKNVEIDNEKNKKKNITVPRPLVFPASTICEWYKLTPDLDPTPAGSHGCKWA